MGRFLLIKSCSITSQVFLIFFFFSFFICPAKNVKSSVLKRHIVTSTFCDHFIFSTANPPPPKVFLLLTSYTRMLLPILKVVNHLLHIAFLVGRSTPSSLKSRYMSMLNSLGWVHFKHRI